MRSWSTDKIAVTGLVIALLVSIIIGIWTGNGVELQTTIASGLVGYIGRAIQEKYESSSGKEKEPAANSKVSETLEKISVTASETQKAVNAIEAITGFLKKDKKEADKP